MDDVNQASESRSATGGNGLSRRSFLGKVGAGAVAATLAMIYGRAGGASAAGPGGALSLSPAPDPGRLGTEAYLAAEEPFFQAFAKTFTVDRDPPYYTIGQKGSMPKPIMQHFKEGLDQIARDPYPVYLEPSEKTRSKIARCYGADQDEIAISRNTTDGITQILWGIPWREGDELLASTMEYPNCVATILRVAKRFNVTVRQFGVPMDRNATAEELVESLRRSIRPGKTKVIFFSAPGQPCGILFPARRIAGLAQQYGIITVVDGAHYGGQFDPRLNETGIDFWAISGHKWQCGPGGTGILYVRNRAHQANPTKPPAFHLVRSGALDAPTDGSRPEGFDVGAALSVYGFPESADWRALGEACELWEAIGRRRIQDYTMALADYTRQKIDQTFGEQALMQPHRDPELKSGIITFNPFPLPSQRRDGTLGAQFQERMFKEYRMRVGMGGLGPTGLTRPPDPEAGFFPIHSIPNRDPVTGRPAPTACPVRFDACLWLTRADMDRFIATCQELVKKII
jgi:isopenicillin-N epimerase